MSYLRGITAGRMLLYRGWPGG